MGEGSNILLARSPVNDPLASIISLKFLGRDGGPRFEEQNRVLVRSKVELVDQVFPVFVAILRIVLFSASIMPAAPIRCINVESSARKCSSMVTCSSWCRIGGHCSTPFGITNPLSVASSRAAPGVGFVVVLLAISCSRGIDPSSQGISPMAVVWS